MRFHAVVILGLPCLFAALTTGTAGAQDDAAKKELTKLEGTWATVSIEAAGQEVTDEDKIKMRKLTTKGDKYTLKVGDETVQGTIEINPGKKPTTIDVKPNSGTNKGKTLLGIYELDGDSLRICLAPPGKDRPTTFTTAAENGHQLVIYKREKP
jgi:uncharacterized protein (TIGR03067 family)